MRNDTHLEGGISGQTVPDFLRDWLARAFARSENFVAGRYWMLEALFLAVIVSVLFSAGVDDRLWGELNGNRWFPAYYQKIEHPLLDVAKTNPAGNHEAKLNFRLTVPVILHVLGVPATQRWILPVLAAGGTFALILISCVYAFRVTRDRVCGLYVALAVSSTYIGSLGFTMYYDSIAIAQLALAMLPGMNWLLRGLLVFTASFTDERAFLASPFLLLQTLCSARPAESARARLLKPESLAVFGGMAAYCLGRLALREFAGLTSPREGIGLELFFGNFPFWHAGFWLALKGGWLLLAVAALCLWQERRFLALAAFAGATVLSVSSGFLVEDVVRSTAYVFPAFLVALMIAGQREKTRWMRLYCLAAFVISLLAGNYNVWRNEITWFRPVAADVLYQALHAVLGSHLVR